MSASVDSSMKMTGSSLGSVILWEGGTVSWINSTESRRDDERTYRLPQICAMGADYGSSSSIGRDYDAD